MSKYAAKPEAIATNLRRLLETPKLRCVFKGRARPSQTFCGHHQVIKTGRCLRETLLEVAWEIFQPSCVLLAGADSAGLDYSPSGLMDTRITHDAASRYRCLSRAAAGPVFRSSACPA